MLTLRRLRVGTSGFTSDDIIRLGCALLYSEVVPIRAHYAIGFHRIIGCVEPLEIEFAIRDNL